MTPTRKKVFQFRVSSFVFAAINGQSNGENMKCKTRFLLSLLIVLAALASHYDNLWSAEKSAKLAPVRIGYVSRSILDMPFIIARDRGYFREEGLEPELIFMKAAQTIPAMLAGGIDFGTATGTAIVAARKRHRCAGRLRYERQTLLRSARCAEHHQPPTNARQKARHYGVRRPGRNSRPPDFSCQQGSAGASYFSSFGHERRDCM